jgi:hypothetical protein
MKLYEFGVEEFARTGFTHKAVLSFAQGDFSAAAVTQTYNLGAPVPSGTIVDNAALKLVTPVAGGTIATATVQVGYTGTTNGFIAAANVFTGATPGAITTPGADLASTSGKGFTAATQLVVVVTSTVGNVAAATAGEVHVYWRQKDLNKF